MGFFAWLGFVLVFGFFVCLVWGLGVFIGLVGLVFWGVGFFWLVCLFCCFLW